MAAELAAVKAAKRKPRRKRPARPADPLRLTWPMVIAQLAMWHGKYVNLSQQEATLLIALATRRGSMLTTDEIDEILWGDDPQGGPEGTRAVRYALVHTLRKKMPDIPIVVAIAAPPSTVGGVRLERP